MRTLKSNRNQLIGVVANGVVPGEGADLAVLAEGSAVGGGGEAAVGEDLLPAAGVGIGEGGETIRQRVVVLDRIADSAGSEPGEIEVFGLEIELNDIGALASEDTETEFLVLDSYVVEAEVGELFDARAVVTLQAMAGHGWSHS